MATTTMKQIPRRTAADPRVFARSCEERFVRKIKIISQDQKKKSTKSRFCPKPYGRRTPDTIRQRLQSVYVKIRYLPTMELDTKITTSTVNGRFTTVVQKI